MQNRFCKNHPSVSSGYLLSGQPWINYCKDCALNVALCGHRIEKSLSKEELAQKIMLTQIVSELKVSTQLIHQTAELYRSYNKNLQTKGEPLIYIIQSIDEQVESLYRMRKNIYDVYETQISAQRNESFELQNTCLKLKDDAQTQIELIESSFGSLIQISGQELEGKIVFWNALNKTLKQQAKDEEDLKLFTESLGQSIKDFFRKVKELQGFRIEIDPSLAQADRSLRLSLATTDSACQPEVPENCHREKIPLKLRSLRKSINLTDRVQSKELVKDVCRDGWKQNGKNKDNEATFARRPRSFSKNVLLDVSNFSSKKVSKD